MLTTNILLAYVLMVGILWVAYQWYEVYKQKKINLIISREVENLYDAVQVQLEQNTKLLERARSVVRGSTKKPISDMSDPLASPEMLASVITVIVGKCGNLRLGMQDFLAVKESDYVSVYVDTATNDLILSLDHGLESTKDISTKAFAPVPDDDTYH